MIAAHLTLHGNHVDSTYEVPRMPNTANVDSPSFAVDDGKDIGSAARIILDKTDEDHWTLRVCGEVGLESADQLKTLLLESLASSKKFELDLTDVCVWDVTLMQLVLATERESPACQGRLG